MDRVAAELMSRGALDADHFWVLIELADGDCTDEDYRQYLPVRRLN